MFYPVDRCQKTLAYGLFAIGIQEGNFAVGTRLPLPPPSEEK